MREIVPTGKKGLGKFILVDDEDYEKLNQFKWHLDNNNYVKRTEHIGYFNGKAKKRTRFMHREIMSCPVGLEIDHVNHNTLDNRKINLRICENKDNGGNKLNQKGDKTSRFKGVSRKTDIKKNKEYNYWYASYAGQFPYTEEGEVAAAKAYDRAAVIKFGEFALTNEMLGLL